MSVSTSSGLLVDKRGDIGFNPSSDIGRSDRFVRPKPADA
jgi:hypothetical protein